MLTQFPDPHHRDGFERSFDFSKLPNVQEVAFGFRTDWKGGGDLPWVPMALSTLRPATSPCLSSIKLDLCPSTSRPVKTIITQIGNDLRRIADEIDRIEREYEGVVNVTVDPHPKFRAVLDSLNVRHPFTG